MLKDIRSYINRPKPEIEFLYRLAKQCEALEFEIEVRDMRIEGFKKRIEELETNTNKE